MHSVRFLDTPNGPIVIADVSPQQLRDEISARLLRKSLSRTLGGAPVLLRCHAGNTFAFSGDPNLQRYAVDPMLEVLPTVEIYLEPGLPVRAA